MILPTFSMLPYPQFLALVDSMPACMAHASERREPVNGVYRTVHMVTLVDLSGLEDLIAHAEGNPEEQRRVMSVVESQRTKLILSVGETRNDTGELVTSINKFLRKRRAELAKEKVR